jgi:predicted GIY-YIG superfamily endonuclease
MNVIRKLVKNLIIYLIENKINRKKYIGLTVQTLEKRVYQHKIDKRKTLIHEAINKYGIDNFKASIIDNAKTMKKLREKEKYWIIKLNTVNPNGYNDCVCPYYDYKVYLMDIHKNSLYHAFKYKWIRK